MNAQQATTETGHIAKIMMNVSKPHVIQMLFVQIQSDLSLVPVILATMETALIVQISMNVS